MKIINCRTFRKLRKQEKYIYDTSELKDVVVPVTYIFNGEVNSSVANMMLAVDLSADKRAIHMSVLLKV